MPKPRLLLISHTYVVGVNRLKIDALAALQAFDITLVVPPFWRDMLRHTPTDAPATTDYALEILPTYLNGKGFYFFFQPFALAQLMRRWQPDIVYVEEEPWSLLALQAGLFTRAFTRARFGFFSWENLYRSHRGPGNLIERWVLHQSAFAIVGNAGAAEVLQRKGFQRPWQVIPQLGLDAEYNRPRTVPELRAQLGLTRPVIGFAGRLVAEKGAWVVLEALATVPEPFDLLVIGNGPLKAEIAARLAEPPFAGRAHLLEAVPHADLPRYINCMDMLISASISTPQWVEQYGLVVLAAMSSEVPVIGTTCGATPKIVQEGGLICRENDPADLRAKVRQLLTDAPLRQQLGAAGRQRVLQYHTNAAVAQNLNTFLLENLSPHG